MEVSFSFFFNQVIEALRSMLKYWLIYFAPMNKFLWDSFSEIMATLEKSNNREVGRLLFNSCEVFIKN